MSPPPDLDGDVSPRFAERRRELESATTNKVTTAADAGRVLALAGDLLRRTEALARPFWETRAWMWKSHSRKSRPQAAEAFVESIDEKAEHDKLARGLEDAFEAILEEGEERVLYMNSAENALTARDALASVRAVMNVASPRSSEARGKARSENREDRTASSPKTRASSSRSTRFVGAEAGSPRRAGAAQQLGGTRRARAAIFDFALVTCKRPTRT